MLFLWAQDKFSRLEFLQHMAIFEEEAVGKTIYDGYRLVTDPLKPWVSRRIQLLLAYVLEETNRFECRNQI